MSANSLPDHASRWSGQRRSDAGPRALHAHHYARRAELLVSLTSAAVRCWHDRPLGLSPCCCSSPYLAMSFRNPRAGGLGGASVSHEAFINAEVRLTRRSHYGQ